MKTLYQYAIVRLLPLAETGEFANVGIVLCAPDTGLFGFQLSPESSNPALRFFPQLDKVVVQTAMQVLTDELNRIQQLAEQQSAQQLFAAFQELTRPREQLIRYSELRSVYTTTKPAELLVKLHQQLVQA